MAFPTGSVAVNVTVCVPTARMVPGAGSWSSVTAPVASLDDTFPLDGEECSLRFVYLHMIGEYARHNGHADLLRERIDGVTGP